VYHCFQEHRYRYILKFILFLCLIFKPVFLLQVVGNDLQVIYDIDCDWPGSTHDARIWARSEVKEYIEQQHLYMIAGDSAYPISETLVKPYSQGEARHDRNKRLFNGVLSGCFLNPIKQGIKSTGIAIDVVFCGLRFALD